MSIIFRHDDNAANLLTNGLAAPTVTSDCESQAALPTLLLMVPCLIAGIWLLVSH